MRNFDDLFNEFFNFKRRNGITPIQEEIKRIIDSLSSFNQIDQNRMEQYSEELGEPDEIHKHEKNGVIIEKSIWNTPHGQIVKVIVTDKSDKPKEKSLEEQLKEAVEAENYELAIKLRDQIKAASKPKRTRKKTNK